MCLCVCVCVTVSKTEQYVKRLTRSIIIVDTEGAPYLAKLYIRIPRVLSSIFFIIRLIVTLNCLN